MMCFQVVRELLTVIGKDNMRSTAYDFLLAYHIAYCVPPYSTCK